MELFLQTFLLFCMINKELDSAMGFSLLQSVQVNVTLRLMLSKAQTTQVPLSPILDGKCLSLNRSEGGADEARGHPILFRELYCDISSSASCKMNSLSDCLLMFGVSLASM